MWRQPPPTILQQTNPRQQNRPRNHRPTIRSKLRRKKQTTKQNRKRQQNRKQHNQRQHPRLQHILPKIIPKLETLPPRIQQYIHIHIRPHNTQSNHPTRKHRIHLQHNTQMDKKQPRLRIQRLHEKKRTHNIRMVQKTQILWWIQHRRTRIQQTTKKQTTPHHETTKTSRKTNAQQQPTRHEHTRPLRRKRNHTTSIRETTPKLLHDRKRPQLHQNNNQPMGKTNRTKSTKNQQIIYISPKS